MLDPPVIARPPASASHDGDRAEHGIRVLLVAPRGFCAGVRRAIDAVRDALAVHGPPVYVRRPIVHNSQVVRELEAEGAIFVEELDEIPARSIVIFSAHGVSPEIAEDAVRRDLVAFDAVCPLVAKVHREVERHRRNGRKIILIGHAGHPEVEGTLGHVRDGEAHVVSSVADVAALGLSDDEPTAFAVQTTYSVDDAAEIVAALRTRFSNLSEPNGSDICYATTNRQAALRGIADRADAVIVAGERFSSNACRLAEVASLACGSVQLVASAEELDWAMIPPRGVVGLTAAASTPETVVQGILDALADRYPVNIEQVGSSSEATIFKSLAVA